MSDDKQLSNPFSTGGGGQNFEIHIQAAYAVLMLSGGFAPALPVWPIYKIKLQGKYAGYSTDDLVVFVKNPSDGREARLLGQIKHSLSFTEGHTEFGEVIKSMWNDFCDPAIFTVGSDVLALITGLISKTDNENVKTILEWARESDSANDFLNRISRAHFSDKEKQEKLLAFRHHLDSAKATPVTDEELWQFLKSFHVMGYDFDIKYGVIRSLIQTIIGIHLPTNVAGLWAQVFEEVSYCDQNAGVLTKDSFSIEITDAFAKKEIRVIPSELISKIEQEIKAGLEQKVFTSEMASVFLVGAWDESLSDDKKIIEKITDIEYRKWIRPVQDLALQPDSLIEQKNRKWKFKNRKDLWPKFGSFIYDDHLDRFKEIAVSVLTEKDPKFELPKDERYAASVYGKNRVFSKSLLQGIAEGAALVGSFPLALTSCSANKAEVTAALLVRQLLASDDWVVWASFNDYLPLLAEASPTEFLDAIEKKLNDKSNTLFRSIFAQEGGAIGGWNYITGVLWGLESLAWSPEFLPRVTILLGQLSEIDPGGNWANRPMNSLTTIYLPWLPQTSAGVEIRKSSIATLFKECPEIAWRLILSLLPNAHQVSSGSHTPQYRDYVPDGYRSNELNQRPNISVKDYNEQIQYYISMAVDRAKDNLNRIRELVDQLDNLSWTALSDLLAHLSSSAIVDLPDNQRVEIWEKLTKMVFKHRKFHDAEWAMPVEAVNRIVEVAKLLEPSSPQYKYRRLFGDHEIYSLKDDYKEQDQDLADQRTTAVREITASFGIAGVLEFARASKYPSEVGQALGRIKEANHDPVLFPGKLIDGDKVISEVVRGYIWERFHQLGWKWADDIDKSGWTNEEKAQFFVCLPFTKDAWTRANALLNQDRKLYWQQVDARPYQLNDDLKEALQLLLQFNRPNAAIACIDWMLHCKIEPTVTEVCDTLLAITQSAEPKYTFDQHRVTELIKWLQNRSDVDQGVLAQIEWAFLPLLDHLFGRGPKALERKLADDPHFFCEVIRTVFKSAREKEEGGQAVTEERKQLASQAFDLLHQWRTPPGTNPDGTVDQLKLNAWVEKVKQLCEESGHLPIALDQIGRVFAYAPADPNGLWIHMSIAEHLNKRDSDEMRLAFNVEKFNMRGTHGYTGGKQERDIANSWRQKAAEVDGQGFVRFATSLRSLADSYDREAKRDESESPYGD